MRRTLGTQQREGSVVVRGGVLMPYDTKIGSTLVRLGQGDICDCQTEAIVNAANTHLWMGGGVAGAIKRGGGAAIEAEAVSKGPIAVGEAVVTGAGMLPAKYVIHAAAMGPDLVTDARKIRAATRNALARAKELALASIAFPALGTGVGGFPVERAGKVMLAEVARHCRGETTLREVVFCLFDTRTLQAFEAVLRRL